MRFINNAPIPPEMKVVCKYKIRKMHWAWQGCKWWVYRTIKTERNEFIQRFQFRVRADAREWIRNDKLNG